MRHRAVIVTFALALLRISSGCNATPYGEAPEPRPKKTTGETLPPRGDDRVEPTLPVIDAGPGPFERPTDAGVDTPARACPGTYRGPYSWKPPPPPSSACTTSDIGFFEGLINDEDATAQTVEAAMRSRNVACASCIFSVETDVTWGFYVYYDAEKTDAFANWGACYANAPGGSEACGRVVQDWFDCMWEVCGDCETEAARNDCWEDARNDPNKCNRFDFTLACNGNLQALDAACATVAQALTVTCGGGGR